MPPKPYERRAPVPTRRPRFLLEEQRALGGTLPVPNPVPFGVKEHETSHVVTGPGFQDCAVGVGLPETQAAVMPCRPHPCACPHAHPGRPALQHAQFTRFSASRAPQDRGFEALTLSEWGLGAGVHEACVTAAGGGSPGCVRTLL